MMTSCMASTRGNLELEAGSSWMQGEDGWMDGWDGDGHDGEMWTGDPLTGRHVA